MLSVSDVEFKHGKSGMMVRCTVNVGLNKEDVWSTTGCLVFREKDGLLRFKPPVIKWKTPSGKLVNLYPNKPSPSLVERILTRIEAELGANIQRDKTEHKLTPSRVDPDLPDSLEFE